jgi:hypothetical protein
MAGEGDIFSGAVAGGAAGSAIPGIGTAIGAGVGLLGGIFSYLGKQNQADAMRRQQAEELRRKKLQDAQVLGQATAAGAASGVEFDSSSLQGYLGTMKSEMGRQLAWQAAAGSDNASNVDTASMFGLITDLGSTLNGYAKDNRYWRGA